MPAATGSSTRRTNECHCIIRRLLSSSTKFLYSRKRSQRQQCIIITAWVTVKTRVKRDDVNKDYTSRTSKSPLRHPVKSSSCENSRYTIHAKALSRNNGRSFVNAPANRFAISDTFYDSSLFLLSFIILIQQLDTPVYRHSTSE